MADKAAQVQHEAVTQMLKNSVRPVTVLLFLTPYTNGYRTLFDYPPLSTLPQLCQRFLKTDPGARREKETFYSMQSTESRNTNK